MDLQETDSTRMTDNEEDAQADTVSSCEHVPTGVQSWTYFAHRYASGRRAAQLRYNDRKINSHDPIDAQSWINLAALLNDSGSIPASLSESFDWLNELESSTVLTGMSRVKPGYLKKSSLAFGENPEDFVRRLELYSTFLSDQDILQGMYYWAKTGRHKAVSVSGVEAEQMEDGSEPDTDARAAHAKAMDEASQGNLHLACWVTLLVQVCKI